MGTHNLVLIFLLFSNSLINDTRKASQARVRKKSSKNWKLLYWCWVHNFQHFGHTKLVPNFFCFQNSSQMMLIALCKNLIFVLRFQIYVFWSLNWVRMYLGLPICFLDKSWSTSKGFWINPTWCCKNDKFMIEVPQLQIGTFCALKPWDLFKFSIMFLKFFKMTYCTDKFKFYRYLWGPVIYSHITIHYSKNILKFLNIKNNLY